VKVIGGVITELQRRYTKKGDLMATFVLEDLNASIEAFVFPKTMADYGALLDDDAIVVVKARLDMRDERLKLVCMEVSRPELMADGLRDLRISLPLGTLTDRTVDDLKRLLADHPGHSPVLLHVGDKVLRLPSEFNVDSSRGLMGELRVLLGPHAIQS
jgi:DNA polymerase-3 subunit alpha